MLAPLLSTFTPKLPKTTLTQVRTQEKRWWCVCVVWSIPYPLPLYLKEGATLGMQLFLAELTLGASEEAPRGKVEAVGPMGQDGRPEGRPASPCSNCPQLLRVGLVWASSCPKVVARPVLTGFTLALGLHLIHLSLILRSDIFCRAKVCLHPAKLAQNHLHTFSSTICGIH